MSSLCLWLWWPMSVALSVSEVVFFFFFFFTSSKYSRAHHLFPCRCKPLASKCIKTNASSCKLLSLLSRTLSVYRPVKKKKKLHSAPLNQALKVHSFHFDLWRKQSKEDRHCDTSVCMTSFPETLSSFRLPMNEWQNVILTDHKSLLAHVLTSSSKVFYIAYTVSAYLAHIFTKGSSGCAKESLTCSREPATTL